MPVRNRWTRLPVLLTLVLLAAWVCARVYRASHGMLRHLEQVVEPELERELGRDVEVGRVYVSGLRRVVVEDLVIPDGEAPESGALMRVPRASIDFGILELWRHRETPAAAISSIRIESPQLSLIRNESGEWNVTSLFEGSSNVSIWKGFHGRVSVAGGRVTVRDHVPGKGVITTQLCDLAISVDAGERTRLQVQASASAGNALRRVAVSGSYRLGRGDLDLRAEFDDADLPFWQHYTDAAPGLPARSGKASGHVRVTQNSGGALRMVGEARAEQVVMTPEPLHEPLVAKTLSIQFDGPRMTLRAEGSAGRIPITASGSLLLRQEDTLLNLRFRAPRLADADARKAVRDWPVLPGVVWDAPAELQAHVTGSSEAWSAKVEGRLPRVTARGFVFNNLRTDMTYHRVPRLFIVRSAQAEVSGGVVRATGRVDVKSTPSRIAFQGVVENVDLAQLPLMTGVPKQGRGNVRFQASGPVDNVHTTFTASASGIRLGPARFRQASAVIELPWEGDVVVKARASGIQPAEKGGLLPASESGSATFAVGDRIRISAAEFVVAGQKIGLTGSATESGELDLILSASGVDAGKLARALGQKGVSGRGNLRAQIAGTLEQPHLSGQIALERGQVQQLGFGRLQAEFDLASKEGGSVRFSLRDARAAGLPFPIRAASGQAALAGESVHLTNLRVDLSQGSVAAHGKASRAGGLDLALNASGLDMGALAHIAGMSDASPLSGVAAFEGRVTGRLDAPRLSGNVTVADGSFRGMSFNALRARVEAGQDRLVIKNAALDHGEERVSLAGNVEARRGQPITIDARVQATEFEVGEALHSLGLNAAISGRGRVDLQVQGTYPDLILAGDFQVNDAVLAGVPVERVSGRLRGPQGVSGDIRALKTQTITVEEILLEDGPARVALSGWIRPGDALALEVVGTAVPLERLSRFTSPYAHLAGAASFSGSVEGRFTQPQAVVKVNVPAMQVNDQDLGAVTSQIGYAAGNIELAGLTVTQGEQVARVDRATFRAADGMLSLSASVEQGDLARFDAILRSLHFPDTPTGREQQQRVAALPAGMRGRFDGTFALSGRWPELSGRAQGVLAQAELGDLKIQRLAGSAAWTPQEMSLQDGVLIAEGVDLRGEIQRHADGRLALEARLGETNIDALRALAMKVAALAPEPEKGARAAGFGTLLRDAVAGLPDPLTGTVAAEIALEGSRGALDGQARLQLEDLLMGEARFQSARATVRWDRGHMAADDLALHSEGVDLRGSFQRGTDGQLALQLHLGETEIAAARDLARKVASALQGTQIGRFLPASLPGVLADLPEPLEGSLSGSFSLAGKPGALRGSINARAQDLRLGQSGITAVSAEGTWSPEEWNFPAIAVAGEKCALSGSIAREPGGRLAGEIVTRDGCLEGLRSMASALSLLRRFPVAQELMARIDSLPTPLAGNIDGSIRFSGTLLDPEMRVALTGSNLVAGTYKLAGVTADADVKGNLITVRDLRVRTNGGELSARGHVDLDGPMALTVVGNDFSLEALGPLLPNGRKLTGHVDLSANVGGTTDIPEADARIVVRNATIAGMRFSRIEANDVRLTERRVEFGRVDLEQGPLAGTLSGSVPFRWDPLEIPTDEPIQLSVSLSQFDLSTAMLANDQSTGIKVSSTPEMRPLLDAIESASGKTMAEIVVTGTLREPNMDGRIELHEGQVKLAALDNHLRDVEASLRLEGPWIIVEQLSAKSDGGGVLSATGRAGIRAQGDQMLDVRLHADRFQMGVRDLAGVHGLGVKGVTSGDLALVGRLAAPVLTGKLQVSKAQMNVPSEITPRLARPPLTLLDPALNIDVEVDQDSWVRRGNAISARVSAGIGIRGKLSNPAVSGRATVERGDLRYAGISFRLQPGGTVSFSYDTPGALVARLDLTADTRVRAAAPATGERRRYIVTMHVTGTIPNVNVAVTSDPPDLPQHRLMAILARTDQFEALARGDNMDEVLRDQVVDIVAGAVLPQVFEPIEEGLAEALGLDEVNFDYGFDRPLRVDARKEVLPRLFVSYNRDMGQGQFVDSGEQWSVTYRLYQRLYVGWRRDTTGNKDRLVLEGSFKF